MAVSSSTDVIYVYAETNFLLEAAMRQEEAEAANSLLALCEAGSAHLVVPGFSVAEAVIHLEREKLERGELSRRLGMELQSLARNAGLRSAATAMGGAVALLTRASEEEQIELDATTRRVLSQAEIVGFDAEMWARAGRYPDLSRQDALVLASVVVHLERSRPHNSVFVSRDAKAFGSEAIIGELDQFGCTPLFHFADAVGFAGRPR